MMLAALMLMGTSAMAQSETLKGDVNGDGAVDVADIAAVIQIMKDNGDIETKYYWYVGQEAVTADNYTTLAESSSTKYTTKNYTTEKFGKVYILVPNIVKSIKVKEVNANVYWEDAAMSVTNPISGYNLYTTNAPKGGSAPLVIEYYYNETTYYWYVGNTSPEGMTPPSVGNANSTLCQWTSLGTSLPTTSIKVYKDTYSKDIKDQEKKIFKEKII